ncbi:MAG: zf-HC2 domain-containing protein [Lachnospiraceae bacterium]
MRLNCKIIEDLLPLYLDNVCSDQSRQMVEVHLKECEECKKLLDSTQTVQAPYIEPERPAAENAIKKGFKKIRLRWWVSMILVIIIIPSLFLGWNQYHNTGIHYRNMYEYYISRAFMEQLQKGNYEKGYGYIDVDGLKQEWLELWFEENELTNIKEEGLAKFCE